MSPPLLPVRAPTSPESKKNGGAWLCLMEDIAPVRWIPSSAMSGRATLGETIQ
jgi:hypothetical protein